jgi:hypothetical protein
MSLSTYYLFVFADGALCGNTHFGENDPKDKDNDVGSNSSKLQTLIVQEAQDIIRRAFFFNIFIRLNNLSDLHKTYSKPQPGLRFL